MGDDEVQDTDGGECKQYDPASFRYVLSFWSQAHTEFWGTADTPGLYAKQRHLDTTSSDAQGMYANHHPLNPPMYPETPGENPLISRQPIIVLREELEYFSIIPSSDSSVNPSSIQNPPHPLFKDAHVKPDGGSNEALLRIKSEAGKQLLERTRIFTALQRNVSKEGNMAEQHLIDMLCMS